MRSVNGSAVVYVMSRKRAKTVAGILSNEGIRADYYHAGLTAKQRALKQEKWIQNNFRVIVATNAFGMGIDKPDVRLVIHYELPTSIESYYQEAGRAGRDGKKSYAVVIYQPFDVTLLQKRFEQSSPDLSYIQETYQGLANYLKLAIGSGFLATYDFDLSHFCTIYNLDPLQAYYAIKKLENEELIQLNEGFYTPSKLFIGTSKQHLYEFQVANARYDPVIKALLRAYGGELFSDFCTIQEKKLADYLGLDISEVKKQLQALHAMELLIYQPLKEAPQITFLTPRLKPENLPINVKKLAEKRQLDKDKIDSMIGYVDQDRRCRSQYILEYFDETSGKNCGVCDICLKRKRYESDAAKMPEIMDKIRVILSESSLSVHEIVDSLPDYQEATIVNAIRFMLDNQQLNTLESGDVSLR